MLESNVCGVVFLGNIQNGAMMLLVTRNTSHFSGFIYVYVNHFCGYFSVCIITII